MGRNQTIQSWRGWQVSNKEICRIDEGCSILLRQAYSLGEERDEVYSSKEVWWHFGGWMETSPRIQRIALDMGLPSAKCSFRKVECASI